MKDQTGRWKIVPERHDSGVLKAMITTDEPGVYLEEAGICTENELVRYKAEKNEYG